VKGYLVANLDAEVSLDDLANLTQLNKHYVRKIFRQATGLSPHAYQRRLRLMWALALLEQGLPPVEVASNTGFADQSHLNRHLKQQIGLTARQYQRRIAQCGKTHVVNSLDELSVFPDTTSLRRIE
jgi:transcriptional regulator GlxA family with amidase domain